jgi:hypothetical protein
VGKLTGKVEVEAAKGFAVRTPTATVTDLGTEFGVEVSKQGDTTSHVFRGSVKLQLLSADAAKPGSTVILHENETVCTEKNGGSGGPTIAVRRVSVDPRTFVRQMAPHIKTLDLLDIVAGGSGTGHHRERGLDPTTGMEDPLFVPDGRFSDRTYQRITFYKLVDGVFSPDGRKNPVQIDSAGHSFDFPRTAGLATGSIWARAATVQPNNERAKDDKYWVYFMGRGERFMPEGRGLLCLNSNAGITFNLEAMRKIYPGTRPIRFRAVAGLAYVGSPDPSDYGMSDIWVLVDGQLKLKQMHIHSGDGVVRVDVEIGPQDRFLTLVSTDGGNDRFGDWIVFGDPVLDMAAIEEGHL